jgi:hypothetical protein
MRTTRPIQIVAASVLASTAFAWTASAEPIGAKPVIIDGYKFGGMLPAGSEKNLDPVRLLIKAADAMGQLRDNGPAPISYPAGTTAGNVYLVLGDTTIGLRIDADGTWNGQKSHVVMDWDYGTPAVRIDVKSADGKSRQVFVAANKLAWDEKLPGVYSGAAQTSANERLILSYLMPSQVILAARDAANVMKYSKEAGRDTLTIPMPILGAGVNLVANFDADGHPVHTQIAYNGHTYTGDFDEFLADRMDMAVNFSHHVVLKTDDKETANLELNWHQSNPYLIFPVPAEVASK